MNSHSKINKYFANINNFTIHLATHNPKQSSTSDSNDASGETNVPLADSYNQNGDKDCDKNSKNRYQHILMRKKHKCKYCDKAFFRL